MKHLDSLGFETSPEDHKNLLPIKEKYGIKPEYGSCHTAVSKEGYVFEGHVPGEYISQFLAENNPNAIPSFQIKLIFKYFGYNLIFLGVIVVIPVELYLIL